MPSFAIPKFTVLLGPLWVSAEFLLLSTGSLLYIISSYSVTRAMNPTCLIERYNEGWVTVLRADMESPSVKAPPDYSLIVA